MKNTQYFFSVFKIVDIQRSVSPLPVYFIACWPDIRQKTNLLAQTTWTPLHWTWAHNICVIWYYGSTYRMDEHTATTMAGCGCVFECARVTPSFAITHNERNKWRLKSEIETIIGKPAIWHRSSNWFSIVWRIFFFIDDFPINEKEYSSQNTQHLHRTQISYYDVHFLMKIYELLPFRLDARFATNSTFLNIFFFQISDKTHITRSLPDSILLWSQTEYI